MSAAAAAASSVPVYATTPPKPAIGSDAQAASNASAIVRPVAAPDGIRCLTIVRAFAPTTRDVKRAASASRKLLYESSFPWTKA